MLLVIVMMESFSTSRMLMHQENALCLQDILGLRKMHWRRKDIKDAELLKEF
jgi:hypothetical protein